MGAGTSGAGTLTGRQGMKQRRNIGQKRLIDPWEHVHPAIRDRIVNGWAGLFREVILPELPVELLEKRYSATRRGRPGKDLYTLLGMAVLRNRSGGLGGCVGQ